MKADKFVKEVLGGDMVLSPADLLGKRFRRALFGGYQNVEVDAFLERVADVLETLIRENRELKEHIEDYRNKSDDYNHMQETLRSALAASQKLGESVIESARRDAGSMMEAARVEKERILAQAAKLPVALAQEINQLQQQRDRLRNDMAALLATHRTLLESQASAEDAMGLGGEGAVLFGMGTATANTKPDEAGSPTFEPFVNETATKKE